MEAIPQHPTFTRDSLGKQTTKGDPSFHQLVAPLFGINEQIGNITKINETGSVLLAPRLPLAVDQHQQTSHKQSWTLTILPSYIYLIPHVTTWIINSNYLPLTDSPLFPSKSPDKFQPNRSCFRHHQQWFESRVETMANFLTALLLTRW